MNLWTKETLNRATQRPHQIGSLALQQTATLQKIWSFVMAACHRIHRLNPMTIYKTICIYDPTDVKWIEIKCYHPKKENQVMRAAASLRLVFWPSSQFYARFQSALATAVPVAPTEGIRSNVRRGRKYVKCFRLSCVSSGRKAELLEPIQAIDPSKLIKWSRHEKREEWTLLHFYSSCD